MICDLAEYYGIYNYREFKPSYLATLVIGLRADSRIKTELSGLKIPLSTFIAATAADRLGLLFWAKTEDGANNRNRPASFVSLLTGDKPKDSVKVFRSPEEFKAAWAKAVGG